MTLVSAWTGTWQTGDRVDFDEVRDYEEQRGFGSLRVWDGGQVQIFRAAWTGEDMIVQETNSTPILYHGAYNDLSYYPAGGEDRAYLWRVGGNNIPEDHFARLDWMVGEMPMFCQCPPGRTYQQINTVEYWPKNHTVTLYVPPSLVGIWCRDKSGEIVASTATWGAGTWVLPKEVAIIEVET